MYKQSQQEYHYGEPILLVESLPERSELCGVIVGVNRPPNGNVYVKTAYQWLVLKCRMLIFAESQILSSPVYRSETQMYIIASKSFVCMGKLKELFEHHDLNESASRRVEVTDSVMQACLHYTLTARLAPNWNQLGTSLLVQGRHFLTETAPMSALKLTIFVQGDQVVLNVWPLRIRLPHLQLCDLELSPEVCMQFISQRISFIPSNAIGNEWMRAMPGLRSGRVVNVSHQIPPSCPFVNYKDIRRHWKNMYGYRLPEQQPGSEFSPAGPYITISFRKWRDLKDVGYTYPALCVRSQSPTFLRNIDHAAVVRDFSSDLSECLTELCGLPFKPTLKIGQPLARLSTAQSQELQNSDSMKATANLTNLSLNNLPSGSWKPSTSSQASAYKETQRFSQNTQIHTQNWVIQNHNFNPLPSSSTSSQEIKNEIEESSTSLTSPTQNLLVPKFTPKFSNNPNFRHNNVMLAQTVTKTQSISCDKPLQEKKKEFPPTVLPKSIPMFNKNSPQIGTAMTTPLEVPTVPSFGVESLGSAAVPCDDLIHESVSNLSAEQHSKPSKWSYPKSACRELQQDTVTPVTSSVPRYVPVFGKKKTKTGLQKSIPNDQRSSGTTPRPMQVSKGFQNPQPHVPLTMMGRSTLQEDLGSTGPKVADDSNTGASAVNTCESAHQKIKPCFTKQNKSSNNKKPPSKKTTSAKKVPKPKKNVSQKPVKAKPATKIISAPVCGNIGTPNITTLTSSNVNINLSQNSSSNSVIPEPNTPVHNQTNGNLDKIVTPVKSNMPSISNGSASKQNFTPKTYAKLPPPIINNMPVKQPSFSFSSSFVTSKFSSIPGGMFKSSFIPRNVPQNTSAIPKFSPCLPQSHSSQAPLSNHPPSQNQNLQSPNVGNVFPQNVTYPIPTANFSPYPVTPSSLIPNSSPYLTGIKHKNTDSPGTPSTPAVKKPRPNKPEPTSEEITQKARDGKLGSVSAPALVKWLKEQNVPCKARDKKATLVDKVLEKLGIQISN